MFSYGVLGRLQRFGHAEGMSCGKEFSEVLDSVGVVGEGIEV